ncbi:MAG: hypothetical protein Q9M40_10920 [Sulfurimonas sp.]|nr:hypothetical protein [Sulfurimonas sp.]
MLHILNILSKSSLESYLIVLDSLQKTSWEMVKIETSSKDVSEFLSIIKTIRDNGATVLLLHHVNETSKRYGENDFLLVVSQDGFEDVSSAFMLEQNRFKNSFILAAYQRKSWKFK